MGKHLNTLIIRGQMIRGQRPRIYVLVHVRNNNDGSPIKCWTPYTIFSRTL